MNHAHLNRAARRRASKSRPRARKATQVAVTLSATAALGLGLMGGVGQAHANPLGSLGNLGGLAGLLENPMVADFIEVCQNADGSTPVPEDGVRPVAVADCSQFTGTGMAVVLPDSIEVSGLLEEQTVDLSDVPLVDLGEKNIIELMSGLALGSSTTKGIVKGLVGVEIDPFAIGEYKSFEEIRTDAMLPVVIGTKQECVRWWINGVLCRDYQTVQYDTNLERRTNALKMVEYMTGESFDYRTPAGLPTLEELKQPKGSSTIAGDGMAIALSMRNGTASATANQLFGLPGVALAGADKGRTSTAESRLGLATALNMDTDEIGLTWFGFPLDLSKLKGSGALELAGEDGAAIVDQIESLTVPALKEVSCFGISTTATAEGLGSCTNYLGTFDSYTDLRAAKPGESRQTQYGLTDVTSLVFGNDALLKQFGMFGGSESTEFMDTLMDKLTSENDRLKFAKDFVRFTQDVRTEYVMEPVVDADGNPVIDEETGVQKTRVKQRPVMETVEVHATDADGNLLYVDAAGNLVDKDAEGAQPKMTKVEQQKKDANGNAVTENVTQTTTAAWLTSDYGLRAPLVIEAFGHQLVLFPAVEINGSTRPNLIGLPEIRKIAADADRGLLPKVSLVQWDNPFGLGTLSLDNPLDVFGTVKKYQESVTLFGDLKAVGTELKISEGIANGIETGMLNEVGSGTENKGIGDRFDLTGKQPENDQVTGEADELDGLDSSEAVGTSDDVPDRTPQGSDEVQAGEVSKVAPTADDQTDQVAEQGDSADAIE